MRGILFLAAVVESTILAGIVRFVDCDCVGSGEVFLELEVGGASGDACSYDDYFHIVVDDSQNVNRERGFWF